MMTLTKRPSTPESRSPDDMMEAIARGVAARLEERTGYLKKITRETADIARAMGVPDREIKNWMNRRTELIASEEARIKEIKARLDRPGVKSYA
jgi:hypothetical protein